jgi:hypothetical protein
LYGGFVVGSDIGCTSGWYHGGMNMCESSVGHPKGPTSGLKNGSPTGFPPGESLGYPPSGGWWSKPLGT